MFVPPLEGEVWWMEREVSGYVFVCRTGGHFGRLRELGQPGGEGLC